MADWNRDLANRISRGELDHAPTPAKAAETTDLREAPTRSWSEMVEAIAKRCDLAVAINQHVGWDTDGADALGKLLRGMATRLDGAKDAVAAAEAAYAAEIQALRAERDAAIKTCDMAAMSGGFYARAAENMERRALTAEARADRLAAENAALRIALEPFANHYKGFAWADENGGFQEGHEIARTAFGILTVGHLRAARAALPEAITPKETEHGR